SRAALARLDVDAAEAACIRVVALNATRDLRLRRQPVERLVPRILDDAHAERPQRRLRRIAHEAAGPVAVVAVAMPAPGGQMDRIPRLPVVANAVHLGPPASFDHEEDRIP